MINLTSVTITAIICITIIIIYFKSEAGKKQEQKNHKAVKEIEIPEFMLNNKQNDRAYKIFLENHGYQPERDVLEIDCRKCIENTGNKCTVYGSDAAVAVKKCAQDQFVNYETNNNTPISGSAVQRR